MQFYIRHLHLLDKMVKTFYVVRCPHERLCTEKSFKRAACKGPTVKDAKEALAQHLIASEFHALDPMEAVTVADDAEIVEWCDEANGPVTIAASSRARPAGRKVKTRVKEEVGDGPKRHWRDIANDCIIAGNKLMDALYELFDAESDDEVPEKS